MPDPRTHELHVEMVVPALPDRPRPVLGLPAWAPGSYMVRDFARHLYDLVVTDERGRPIPVVRLDKQRWEVDSDGRAFRVRYRIFAFEIGVRTSFLDQDRAFWNGTSVFLYVDGELQRPCVATVQPPRGWAVSVALPQLADGGYAAANYDELVDSPFECGTHDLRSFTVDGTRFEVALVGRTNADVARVVADLRRIVTATGRMFGGFPFRRFLFIVHWLPQRGGGLEHAASTTLDYAGLAFEDQKAYREFAELAAHEFFHAWNVKRIHDRVLGPFDYRGEAYTRLLWFHEGFTEYMESIILLRAGVIDADRYLESLADEWPRFANRPGRRAILSDLSFEAWIKQYKPGENFINRSVSYYEKGKWVALLLELELRAATGGRRGLPDLFRLLWRRHGRKNEGIGVEELQRAVADVGGTAAAVVQRFFRRYVDGADELPVPAALRAAGLDVELDPPGTHDDDVVRGRRKQAWAGLSLTATNNERAVIRNVIPDSPAFVAGLTYGDELVAVDGFRVNAGSVPRRLADARPGQRVPVSFFRQDQLRTATLVMGREPGRTLSLAVAPGASAAARAVRRGWLGA